ncbi:MAG: hypothetical protein ACRD0G_15900 [Acidimicrobiales bacterium]
MATTDQALLAPSRPAADVAMRRLLRIPDGPRAGRTSDARRAFSTSMLVSAIRCTLTYVVLPFVAPALGLATGVGPFVGIPIGVVAIAANVVSIRRFWLADHKWRWGYTAIGLGVIVLLLTLLVGDVAQLLD